jgi:hypothetical protein
MRPIRIVIVTAFIAATLTGVWLTMQRHHQPTASIHLIGYKAFTMSNPDPNIFVYPGRGSWIQADLVLTNEGSVSISYEAWGDEPYGWANVQTDQGTTNGYLAPHFSGGTVLLRPGCAATFWVLLPTNALQWQCGFDIKGASVRERAIRRVLSSRLYRLVPEVVFYPVRLLPNKTGPSVELKSGLFDIPENPGQPHNKSPYSTPR